MHGSPFPKIHVTVPWFYNIYLTGAILWGLLLKNGLLRIPFWVSRRCRLLPWGLPRLAWPLLFPPLLHQPARFFRKSAMVHWPLGSKRACSAFLKVMDTLNDTRAHASNGKASSPGGQGRGQDVPPCPLLALPWDWPESMSSFLKACRALVFFPCLGRDPSPLTNSRFQAELSHATVPQNSPSWAVFIAVWDSNGPICLNFHCFCVEHTPHPWTVSLGFYWWGVLG